jgi:amino acid transporter
MYSALKRVVLGSPIATSEEHHTRLPKSVALPVFASDAISSTAYATQEILIVLIPAVGLAATTYLVPLAVVVCILLAIVITSYRQTIMAYPGGGGTYIVSRENLGPQVALVAGASILVDYVLTVAVSVSAGVAAITSAFPELSRYRVGMCLGFIALMTVANLRGLKESGMVFAPPTYIYITILFAMIILGLFRYYTGDLTRLPPNQGPSTS